MFCLIGASLVRYTNRNREKEVVPLNTTDEAFYRRFTLPEELKNRSRTATEWCGVHRWFASPNVIKLEDHREPGEMGRILERLRQRKHAASTVAVANILAEARKRRRQ
jgi:hypothetical protein